MTSERILKFQNAEVKQKIQNDKRTKAFEIKEYKFTDYFENEVLKKRPYIKKKWCIRVVENPIRSKPQEHNRFKFWGEIPEFGDRILRVITLEDGETIHNAFLDRSFKP